MSNGYFLLFHSRLPTKRCIRLLGSSQITVPVRTQRASACYSLGAGGGPAPPPTFLSPHGSGHPAGSSTNSQLPLKRLRNHPWGFPMTVLVIQSPSLLPNLLLCGSILDGVAEMFLSPLQGHSCDLHWPAQRESAGGRKAALCNSRSQCWLQSVKSDSEGAVYLRSI